MTNQEKAIEERNREKELNEKRHYEIYLEKEEIGECGDEDIVAEICELLIAKKLSYRQANRALYVADKALRMRALDKKLL